jgi:sugar phosphate isomerase/epimerase
MHTAFLFEQYEKMPYLLDLIETFISEGLMKYERIIFCIENVIPCKVSNKGGVYFRNGVFFDNVKLVKYLREKLNTDRIGTVLDTCHMFVTLELLRRVFTEEYKHHVEDINMRKFFEENSKYCELIHLCDVKGLGYNKGEHGIKFEREDMFLLGKILQYYQEFDFRADITIEILEEDYIENHNFKDNYTLVKSLLTSNGLIVK